MNINDLQHCYVLGFSFDMANNAGLLPQSHIVYGSPARLRIFFDIIQTLKIQNLDPLTRSDLFRQACDNDFYFLAKKMLEDTEIEINHCFCLEGDTPLLNAIQLGNPRIVRLLLNQKGRIDTLIKNNQGLTAAALAKSMNKKEIVDIFADLKRKVTAVLALTKRQHGQINLPLEVAKMIARLV